MLNKNRVFLPLFGVIVGAALVGSVAAALPDDTPDVTVAACSQTANWPDNVRHDVCYDDDTHALVPLLTDDQTPPPMTATPTPAPVPPLESAPAPAPSPAPTPESSEPLNTGHAGGPEVTPPAYVAPNLNCPAWTSPGWLNSHGDATACLWNMPGTEGGTMTLTACAEEDSLNCYWDASTRGNGQGRSFININGTVFFAEGN